MNITNDTIVFNSNELTDSTIQSVKQSFLLEESVKENRKVMSHFLKKIQELKQKSYSNEQIIKQCNDILKKYLNKVDRSLFTLEDEEKNTCKILVFIYLYSASSLCSEGKS